MLGITYSMAAQALIVLMVGAGNEIYDLLIMPMCCRTRSRERWRWDLVKSGD